MASERRACSSRRISLPEGLRSGVGPARFSLQKPGKQSFDLILAPVTAASYLRLMSPAFPSFVYVLPRRPT
jgi:hypothetical protein